MLSQNNRLVRVDIATALLSRKRDHSWLRYVTMGDEKWVLYANVKRQRSWVDKGATAGSTAKPEFHQKKVMLCIWWNSEGIVHYEFLPKNTTVTAEVYCEQLQRLTDAMPPNRPKILLHDNARPHVARSTREKLLQLGWETLPHPPYSPDLAPSDYHLFRSLQNFLQGKTFGSTDEVQNAVREYLSLKNPDFYHKGIFALPARWRYVIINEGDYVPDNLKN